MNHQLDQQTLDRIVEQIVKVLNPEKIILFGSYARGEAGPDSDVDIAVIAETSEPGDKAIGEISWGLRHLHLPLDLLLFAPEKWHRFRQVWSSFPTIIEESGRVIYERVGSAARAGTGVVR